MSQQYIDNVLGFFSFLIASATFFTGIFMVSDSQEIFGILFIVFGLLLMGPAIFFARNISYDQTGNEVYSKTIYEDFLDWVKK